MTLKNKYNHIPVNSGTGDGNYYSDTEVTITADAAPEGKTFDHWVINSGSPAIADSQAAGTTLTMPANAAVVTATYKDILTGIDNNGLDSQLFNIYPNPADAEFSFDLTVENYSDISISFIDLSGREEGKSFNNRNLDAGNHTLIIPVSDIKSGIYLMHIKVNNTDYMRKILIH